MHIVMLIAFLDTWFLLFMGKPYGHLEYVLKNILKKICLKTKGLNIYSTTFSHTFKSVANNGTFESITIFKKKQVWFKMRKNKYYLQLCRWCNWRRKREKLSFRRTLNGRIEERDKKDGAFVKANL